MRWLVVLACGCGTNIDLAPADLAGLDLAELDLSAIAQQDLLEPDLASPVDLLFLHDMSAAIDMAMTTVLPDLLGIDFAPCGQPNGECCTTGTDCDQTAAMNFGFVGAICSSGECVACGKPAQPCCAMDKCVRSASLNANCTNDIILGKICVECGGGGEPACTP